jgi:hypothetical protein
MNDKEKESEYYTIIELLEVMSFKKVLLVMFSFYLFVFSTVMSFIYWYLNHHHR